MHPVNPEVSHAARLDSHPHRRDDGGGWLDPQQPYAIGGAMMVIGLTILGFVMVLIAIEELADSRWVH
jgi:hypothetical protein